MDIKFDIYKLLDVSRNASEEDIIKQFRKKSMQYHPDKNPNCEELMKKLNIAKMTLLDHNLRAEYDDKYESEEFSFQGEKVFLPQGQRISDEIKHRITNWISEFKYIEISDNSHILIDILDEICSNLYELKRTNIEKTKINKEEILNNKEIYEKLKKFFYNFCSSTDENDDSLQQMVLLIKNRHSSDAVKKLYGELMPRKDIENLPNKFKAALLMLKGSLFQMDKNLIESLKCYEEALILYPVDQTCKALSFLIDDRYLPASSENLQNQLNEEQLIIPESHLLANKLKSSPNLRAITRSEKSIVNNKNMSNFDKAMLYIDLSMAAFDTTIVANNYIIAAIYLLEEMKTDCKTAQKYALRNAICFLIQSVFFIATRYTRAIIQLHFTKLCFILMKNSHQLLRDSYRQRENARGQFLEKKLIGPLHEELLKRVINTVSSLIKVNPFVDSKLSLSADIILLDLIENQFLDEYYIYKIESNPKHPWNYLFHYFLFDGVWKNNRDDELFQKYRENSMRALLNKKGWDIDYVESIMSWKKINRDANGWFDLKRPNLNLSNENFHSVEGVVIDIENGTIELLFEPTSKTLPALIDMNDVDEILSKGITNSYFTLDQPDSELQEHPFQEMKYGPASLNYTEYLGTLLHADYLLKMFSMGNEVSAKKPFLFRDSSESFIKLLPDYLQEKVRPIHKRKDGRSWGNVNRFWIESGDLPYHRSHDKGKITYKFGFCPLQVKKHLMRYNADGILVDDESDEENNDADDCGENKKKISPEKEFANDFTEYYEAIGYYFPVLLRLRELLKLGAVSVFLQSIYQRLNEMKNNFEIEIQPVKDSLKEMRLQIKYPVYSEYEVDQHYRQVLRDNGIYDSSSVAYSEERRVKSDIRRQLKEADETIPQNTAENIAKSVGGSNDWDLRINVDNWLKYGNDFNLAVLIAKRIKIREIAKLDRFIEKIKLMGINLDSDKNSNNENQDCVWVPSAFRREDKIKIYGGVNLRLNLVEIQNTTSQTGAGSASHNRIHKNNLNYTGKTHLYVIKKLGENRIYKVGISSAGERVSDSKSIRAEKQARDLLKQTNETYVTEIRRRFSTRREAYDLEHTVNVRAKNIFGPGTLPGNKNKH